MLNRLGGKVVTVLFVVLVMAAGLAAGFVYDDDANAAKKKEPKILWAVVSLPDDMVSMAFTTRHSICR